jgi:hypothetical protein
LKGKHLVEVTEFKTKRDSSFFVKRIADEQYQDSKRITLVKDNFKTYTDIWNFITRFEELRFVNFMLFVILNI